MNLTNSKFTNKDNENFKLADYWVASSFISFMCKNQLYDYCLLVQYIDFYNLFHR